MASLERSGSSPALPPRRPPRGDVETRLQALGPLLSRVVNDEDLAVLSIILEQMDDLNDVARLRQTCRVLRDGVDACMKMNHMRVVTSQDENFAPSTLRQGKASSWRDQMRLQAGGWLIKDPDVLGKACGLGRVEIVRLLLEVGGDKDKADNAGRTPLYMASNYGHLEIVRLLLEAGADVKHCPSSTGWKMTSLLAAVTKNYTKIVDLLVRHGATIDQADDSGCTPLFIACQEGNLEIVQLLVKAGADLQESDSRGWTPLFVAAEMGHLEIVRLLVKTGAIQNKPSNLGNTPATIAEERGFLDVVNFLKKSSLQHQQACRRNPPARKAKSDAESARGNRNRGFRKSNVAKAF
jgi:ankyrin repeat protein